ncbi:hypothetical protein DPM19_08840 [Actinomadura craniellae]|uniref:Squalene cyclase C-terminal domain-containing protein n=1 Tax=Actinomadura craniellae TaxID=2231787 RepID=A0A365HAR8_9ACTN|nr:hypothetical protein DPM19_08840 [Actinomadura craniellae]
MAEIAAAAQELVDGLLTEPWGRVSPSVYETGRVISLTPWLAGHRQRLDYLVATQRPDGGWGAPDPGYALVPTLSATEALLAARPHDPELARSAERGVAVLRRWLSGGGPALPDMPAIEHLAPALIELINRRLAEPLPSPPKLDGALLPVIRSVLTGGGEIPEKLIHALELAGDAARGLPALRPQSTGTIGASPAATAAWLGDQEPEPDHPARRYLEEAARPHGGPVPCGLPITVFERGWVLGWLARAGIPVTVPDTLVRELADAVGERGAPAAAGLPADADTTSGALYALALLGAPRRPDPLWAYEAGAHFATWPGEDGVSVSTNAHVLEAFGQYAAAVPAEAPRYAATIARVGAWLAGRQEPDGSWRDRWHASPYYATACCALALERFGGATGGPAVHRARRWVLDSQRPDGSWGHWSGTAEETAYAMQILLLSRPADGESAEAARAAVARGLDRLPATAPGPDEPALWHDKDLYLPTAIVRSAVLAARGLALDNAHVSSR